MGSNQALAILLDAPMQSWGVSSRFQRRGTESFPTKSGVIGLIAAAMGIDKQASDEAQKLAPLASLTFAVFAVCESAPHGKIRQVIRLEDFHTVGGGYDSKNPVERLHITQKAEGGTSTTIITSRTYLTDARFVAVLEGDTATLEQIAQALKNPRWGVWLGRKNCIPASPLAPELGETSEAVIKGLLSRFGPDHTYQITEAREERNEDGCWFQSDQPLSFGKREFQSRPICRG